MPLSISFGIRFRWQNKETHTQYALYWFHAPIMNTFKKQKTLSSLSPLGWRQPMAIKTLVHHNNNHSTLCNTNPNYMAIIQNAHIHAATHRTTFSFRIQNTAINGTVKGCLVLMPMENRTTCIIAFITFSGFYLAFTRQVLPCLWHFMRSHVYVAPAALHSSCLHTTKIWEKKSILL